MTRRRLGRVAQALLGLVLLAAPAAALRPASVQAQATPAEFQVTSPVDTGDVSIGDGICRAFGGQCTLRAAIQESNALPGINTIRIGAGVYELEVPDAQRGRRLVG